MKPDLPDVPASTGRVCIDFDGTLAEGVWPSPRIGKPMGKGIAILIYYASQGREVIVYTARPESHKERIFAWLRMSGLQDHVYDVVCNKPVADIYIDDKAWNPWIEPEQRRSLGQWVGAVVEEAGEAGVPSVEAKAPVSSTDTEEEGERAVSSGAPSLGSALSKAASPSPSQGVYNSKYGPIPVEYKGEGRVMTESEYTAERWVNG
jgi:hypothetical protein